MGEQPHISIEGHPANAERVYGERWADRYDQVFEEFDVATIEFLRDLAGFPGRALELAVGTGRVAIPLASLGVDMTGVDISEAMVAKLTLKPGGSQVSVVVGDMVEVPVEGEFPMVFVAFNSFFAISTQDRQVRCFRNVSKHLGDGGRFVVECFVPDMKRFDDSHRHVSEPTVEQDGGQYHEISIHDPVHQRVESQHVWRDSDGTTTMLPVSIRYAWPAELDVMAMSAGLALEDRWGWYDRSPFTADSQRHVSVYRKESDLKHE